MTPVSTTLVADTSAAIAVLSNLCRDIEEYHLLDDPTLTELSRMGAALTQLADRNAAIIAGEVALRSTREHGSRGLAQRNGYSTPEEFVRATTGSTAREAKTAILAGRLAHDSVPTIDASTGSLRVAKQPWLAVVGRALVGQTISVDAAESIGRGLGEPTADIGEAQLAHAAAVLCAEAPGLDADRLYQRARQLRDELDEAGIIDREAARREQRGLRYTRLPSGMARISWTLDPESAAVCGELFDRTTSPRRGGPRFVGAEGLQKAQRILDDARTTEQLASDVFLELLQQGAAADSSQLLGAGPAVVRVLVTAKSLEDRSGHGWIEGQQDPVSLETVERQACLGSVQQVSLDEQGQPLDVGREQRLFTAKQRVALAARDGGCMVPGCDRPPSWTEAHHLKHWARDGGKTDIANGILLCRSDHLRLHNNGWEITFSDGQYWLVPPPDIDPAQTPRLMLSKSAAFRQAMQEKSA